MKLYSISRILYFEIFARFPSIQLSHAGELFVSGFLSDSDAEKILQTWPNSISLISV